MRLLPLVAHGHPSPTGTPVAKLVVAKRCSEVEGIDEILFFENVVYPAGNIPFFIATGPHYLCIPDSVGV